MSDRKFSGVPDYAGGKTFPEIFNGLFFRLTLCAQNLKFVALKLEIIGVPK